MSEPATCSRSSIQRRTRSRRPEHDPSPALATSHSFAIHNSSLSDGLMDTFVETSKETSRGTKRVVREPLPVQASSPVKRLWKFERTESTDSLPPLASTSSATEPQEYSVSLWEDDLTSSVESPSHPHPPKSKKSSKVSDPCMEEWVSCHRESFLDALIWLDGRGWYNTLSSCPGCGDESHNTYRCRECSHAPLLCRDCIVAQHAANPLHWIEHWNGLFFQRKSLKSAGLRIQLGHVSGEKCLLPRPGNQDFLIIHINGVHEVAVDFCGCALHDSDPGIQLLRSSYYPATGTRPRTCATLACLNDFHALSLHGKTTAYDYYRALEYRTSGAGIKPLDRYKAFMRMARQYRHLLLLKRRGRGHTAKPIVATRSGELAIWCAACPHPGINLPDNWMDASPADQCLYIQFIAMDACFRLKRRLIGSDIRDLGLGTGWAYLVEWEPYRQYLLMVTDQKEISSCTGLAALDHANTKFARGYSATGVGAGICARHEFVLANGVGDLQRGERYANMDYILASLLRHIHAALRKMFSYDIACQWGKDLKNRLLSLPPLMHINAHIWLCRVLFHLSLIPGSGATDGEGIERLWAAMRGLAGSTKLSGHGARADQLDDHWTFWNWSKLLGLAKLLRRRLQNAKVELCKQEDSFRVFSAQQAEHVPEWLQMVKEFEEDGEKPNPYASSEPEGMSEAAVRKLLEEEDREEMQKGRAALHAVTPSEFIVLGLELEDEHGAGNTIRLKPLRKKLTKTIKQLRDLQATYSPTSLTRLSSLKLADDIHAEDIPLLLPSSPKSERAGCHAGLVSIERRLRDAQCKRALVQLRHQLHIKARLLIYKKHQSRNQGMNTRSRALVARNELCAVEDGVVWPPLLASDIRCLEDPDEISKREACNRRQLATRLQRQVELVEAGLLAAEDVGVTDDEAEEEEGGRSICVQVEEVLRGGKTDYFLDLEHGGDERNREFAPGQFRILQEEIRRLPLSLRHEEHLWDQRAAVAEERGGDAPIREGRKAYARKQAAVYRELIW
ncbi:CxC2 domain-containing protein [Mycena kentingensis (nom. inval.)]|nr:CxC2 domain-containing protein [Mycena kentingensis (nom. inval.)]